jgi:hypothetical protein
MATRTLDKRSVEIRGTDGHFEPYQDIEREDLRVDASTVRTAMRTFARDVNGRKALVQVTEEEKHILPGDYSNIVRVTYNPRCQWTASTSTTRNRGDEKDRKGSGGNKYDGDAPKRLRRFGSSFQDARAPQARRERYSGKEKTTWLRMLTESGN